MRIGVLEDDAAICDVLTEILERKHHTVSIYQQGWDIFDAVFFEESVVSPLPFDVLLVDLLLQGEISGVQVIAQMHQFFPNLPIVIVSAVSAEDLVNVKRIYPQVQIIHKPFTTSDLLAALERAVSYS